MRQGLSRTDMFVQGVGGVLHDDAGSVTLYLEVTNPGDVGMVLAAASLASLWRASKCSGSAATRSSTVSRAR